MPHRVEVAIKAGLPDAAGASLRHQLAEDLGMEVDELRVIDVYTIDAEITAKELERVRKELFTDPVIQDSRLDRAIARDYDWLIEVGFRPGVTDNVGKTSAEGIVDTIGRPLKPGEGVYKSTQYAIKGALSADQCDRIARDLLAGLIQRWVVRSSAEMNSNGQHALLGVPAVTDHSEVTVREISLDLASHELAALSKEMMLALDVAEMNAIQAHYQRDAIREARAARGLPVWPTDIELEILAQTWSEHCKHKIFAATIDYTDADGNTRTIDSLFKTYVKAATDEAVAKKVDWLVSVFHDNAGHHSLRRRAPLRAESRDAQQPVRARSLRRRD
jgi:phosphoribosylformylglycinamidine synthase subunit PurSL